ncbi:putative tRNA-specific adenosine deaminase [Cladorrhinum sp. PSN259]|nr:putative tRNA-specific adenosine deaminase [Cladorrhinum sp. PSN259]
MGTMKNEMGSQADEIVSLILEEFGQLPPKRRPAVRDNGLHEWVPLSGIVVKGPHLVKCVALATGMKCLPSSKLLEANGVAIHDWHAEVLALRAFNRFLLDECHRLAQETTAQSDFLSRQAQVDGSGKSPFLWRKDLTLHMYCSEAPCGDASMELTISAQADPTPWASPRPTPSSSDNPAVSQLLGRGHFSSLGIVRRKPARGDAPPTTSKSCSDKIALKQCTSLLSSLTSLLISPENIYLTSLILPESQYSEVGCTRCFGIKNEQGRMSCLRGKQWDSCTGYKVVPFAVETTSCDFNFSKRTVAARSEKTAASNLAVAWTADGKVEEGLIGGVLQGRKAFTLKGASAVSRRSMWALTKDVAQKLGDEKLLEVLSAETYDQVKEGRLLEGRRKVKDDVRGEALKGWLRNTGDGTFSLSRGAQP